MAPIAFDIPTDTEMADVEDELDPIEAGEVVRVKIVSARLPDKQFKRAAKKNRKAFSVLRQLKERGEA